MKLPCTLLTIAVLLTPIAVLLTPGAASAQDPPRARALERAAQRQPGAVERPMVTARRDTLEARVIGRFVERAGGAMTLNAEQRRRLDATLQATADRRRSVNQRSNELQRRLNQAVRRQDTPQAVFSRLLTEQRALRLENQRIIDQEQTALGQFLTPRQQAHFLTLWVRLQQDARQIQAQRPDGGPVR